MNKVGIHIGADGTQFHKTMEGIEKRLHGLSHIAGASHGVKEGLAALVGGGTIALAVHSMVEFSKNVLEASERMGTTIEKTQQWRTVARYLGKDLDFVESAMRRVGVSASDTKKMALFNKLGLKPSEVQGAHALNNSDLLQRVVGGANKLGRATGGPILDKLLGKGGSALLGQADKVEHLKDIHTAEAEQIKKLAELAIEYENLVDLVRNEMIPVLANMVEWAEKFVQKTGGEASITKAGIKAMVNSPDSKKPGWFKQAVGWAGWGISSFAGQIFDHTKNRGEHLDKNDLAWREWMYGKKATQQGENAGAAEALKVAAKDADFNARAEARRKAKTDDGTVNRQALPTQFKKLLDDELKTKNPMLKIGNLHGIDTQYRLERLNEKQVELLSQIVKNTSPHDLMEFDPEYDPFANAA